MSSCTNPLTGYQLKIPIGDTNPMEFIKPPMHQMMHYNTMQVGCNKCDACLGIRISMRSIQMYCELMTTEGDSYFTTNTYSDDNIPDNMSLYKPHHTNFIQETRRYTKKNNYPSPRYEMCAEYGGQTFRPHYHYCLFGLQIDDLLEYRDNGNYKTYTSKTMSKLWPHGAIEIQALTFANCLYIAKHIEKRLADAKPHHEEKVIDVSTGEYSQDRVPEYSTRSSKPGIGAEWFKRFGKSDLYNTDSFVVEGNQYKIPPFFDRLMEREDPELLQIIKDARQENAVQKTRAENKYQALFNRVNKIQRLAKRNII